MLAEYLTARGFSVVCLNGSMDMDERRRTQQAFATDARIMISTEAGGEGLNLQFCHIAVNYDLPWNPMRVEQRIGRVDRIGQDHPVRAFNLVMENSIDERVLTIFEEKLSTILNQLGVDKRDDVLETVGSQRSLEQLYVTAITNPERFTRQTAEVEEQARIAIEGEQEFRSLVADQSIPVSLRTDVAQW